jgi:hypothetical protein
MASTLCLELNDWDLCVDTSGHIALATEPYSIAQDVACACRTFIGECWYDTTYGIPYLQQVLGQLPSLSVIKALLVTAAATVPGCGNPIANISSFQNRQLVGQIQFIDNLGQPQVVNITVPIPMQQLTDNAGNLLFDNAGNPLFSQ